jgi:hypothetical protein
MKTTINSKIKSLTLFAALALLAGGRDANAQGTAFTYQGQLFNGGSPANGSYDLRFSLYTVASGGTLAYGYLTNSATAVSNGLFTVTLDFGAGIFNGTTYWLQIGVRTNGNSGFNGLSPRQELTPTPNAIYAETANGAGISGTVPLAQLPPQLGLVSDPGFYNFFAGQGAGNGSVTGSYNIGVGGDVLLSETSGAYNTAMGISALYGDTTGSYNSAFGALALLYDSTSSYNTASGFEALSAYPLTGNNNTAYGVYAAAADTSGSNNVAIGYGALQYESSDNGEVAVGYEALQNDVGGSGFLSVGYANTAVGYEAMQTSTTGSGDTALGYLALYQNTTGANNTALGVFSLFSDNTGGNNTAIGDYAFTALTTGSGNIAIGVSAGVNLVTGNNNIYIGSSGSASDNNVVRIGDTANQVYLPSLNVDENGYNVGDIVSNALTFGISSGEGIASKRSNGAANRYDLEFWTDFAERMKIAQGGNVGIRTDNPSQALEVNGSYAQIDGANAANGNGPIDAYIGGNGSGSDVQIGSFNSLISNVAFYNWGNSSYMHVYCSSITIEGGSDLAEPFKITKADKPVEEGEVVVIDDAHPGQLKLTDQPYDTRVAGVVSGANGIHPGIQMQQQGLLEGGKNVALTGRVYVQADASNGPIKPGDLLTTSSTPGRAMRVSDHLRAQGAILGKAMTALQEGKGMVLVLVTLQ